MTDWQALTLRLRQQRYPKVPEDARAKLSMLHWIDTLHWYDPMIHNGVSGADIGRLAQGPRCASGSPRAATGRA